MFTRNITIFKSSEDTFYPTSDSLKSLQIYYGINDKMGKITKLGVRSENCCLRILLSNLSRTTESSVSQINPSMCFFSPIHISSRVCILPYGRKQRSLGSLNTLLPHFHPDLKSVMCDHVET